MRYTLIALLVFVLCGLLGVAQRPEVIKTPDQGSQDGPRRILKAQHEEARKLSTRLIELATEVDADVEKGGENVLPLATLKKLEEIEKISKKLRGVLKQ